MVTLVRERQFTGRFPTGKWHGKIVNVAVIWKLFNNDVIKLNVLIEFSDLILVIQFWDS